MEQDIQWSEITKIAKKELEKLDSSGSPKKEATSPYNKRLKIFDEVSGGINISKFHYIRSEDTNRMSGRQVKINARPIPIEVAEKAETIKDLAPYFVDKKGKEAVDRLENLKDISKIDLQRLRLFAEYVKKDRDLRIPGDEEVVSKIAVELTKLDAEHSFEAAKEVMNSIQERFGEEGRNYLMGLFSR